MTEWLVTAILIWVWAMLVEWVSHGLILWPVEQHTGAWSAFRTLAGVVHVMLVFGVGILWPLRMMGVL